MRGLKFLFVVFLFGLNNACATVVGVARAQDTAPDDSGQHDRAQDSGANKLETRAIGPFQYPMSPRGLQKLLPDISLIASFTGGYFSDDPAGATGHDPARTGFTLQEIELAIQSVVDPYFRADVFLSFPEAGVELEEAYVTTLGLPKGLQIRGGKFQLPFGRHNQKHLEQWHFIDNMLVTKNLLGPENLNEIGVEVSYLFPLPFFLQLQGTFTNGDNDTSFGGRRKQDFLYQGRVYASFDLSAGTTLLIGGSGATGFNSTGLGNQTQLYGGDLLVKWRPRPSRGITWQSEYIFRSLQGAGTLLRDGGAYSYLDFQFHRRWHAGARFDYVGLPDDVITREWRFTPALTFDPTEFSRLRAQYSFDKTNGADGVHAAFLQLQFNIGTHGAHAF